MENITHNKALDDYKTRRSVVRVWEHELKSPKKLVNKLVRFLVTAHTKPTGSRLVRCRGLCRNSPTVYRRAVIGMR